MDTVVVGVDGSDGATRALHWAAEDARRRHARLRVVLAWEYPPHVVGGVGWVVPDESMLGEQEALMAQRLDDVLVRAAAALEGIEVERSVVHGAPAPALLEAARDADLLVVGTRGHGGFVGLLLGSVSQQCVHHAACPVVVVPPDTPR